MNAVWLTLHAINVAVTFIHYDLQQTINDVMNYKLCRKELTISYAGKN